MLVTICICVLIVVLTIAVHSGGTFLWLWYQIQHKDKHIGAWTKRDRWRIFLSTALVLMALHMIEAFLWAITNLVLPAAHQIKTSKQPCTSP